MAEFGGDQKRVSAPADRPEGPSSTDERYDIRIGRDGTWYYRNSPIERIGLVKLFASVLRRDEAGDYWLVTPAERGRIQVEDAPFNAVEVDRLGEGGDQLLRFRTNLDEQIEAGADHPIETRVDVGRGETRPYLLVRDHLYALIARPVYYRLVDYAVDLNGQIGVWSHGVFFPLGESP